MVTDPQANPQTGPITVHCATASTQCNYKNIKSQNYNNMSMQR